MVKRILKQKNISFYVDEYQAIGLVYPFEGQDYIVTAAAYDGYGYANRDALRNMLILLFIGGLTVLAIVGYILSRSTLKPIRNIVKEAEKITASHIDKRLPVKNEQGRTGRTEYYIQCTAGTFGEVLQLTKDVCQQCIS